MVRRKGRLPILFCGLTVAVGCGRVEEAESGRSPPWVAARAQMVREQIEARGIRDPRVLSAMGRVPRHSFLPEAERPRAYEDRPLDIGENQTISRPYIVALLTELAGLDPQSRVLEIGTGSGYGAAVLSEVAGEVYTIEILDPLAERASSTLRRLGYDNVKVRCGDGYRGWPEVAPFDAIVVTAAPPRVPEPLKQQLKPGGRLVLPVGETYQEIRVVTRTAAGFVERDVVQVRIDSMTGEALRDRR
ncbi:MAG: protein-L-isoaspartate(D-aspartate) O-methyltransferase [Planctomycetota bacterium]|jgi:protein-L-isoaspartate(D-aspartate) O-methyltransferase